MMEQDTNPEVPFVYSLREVAQSVYIPDNASNSERARKVKNGFYVTKSNRDVWAENAKVFALMTNNPAPSIFFYQPQEFNECIQLLATDQELNSSLTVKEEKAMRLALFKGAESQIAVSRSYLVAGKIYGTAKLPEGTSPSADDVRVRIKGLEKFQQKLTVTRT